MKEINTPWGAKIYFCEGLDKPQIVHKLGGCEHTYLRRKKPRKGDEMPEGYKIQRDISCCKNCLNADMDDDEILMICTLTKEEVDAIGICDQFEFDETSF